MASHSREWRSPFSPPAYFHREQHIDNQAVTQIGRTTFWVLVDMSAAISMPRWVIASCETHLKKALVTGGDGEVEEVVSHGKDSVIGSPEFRREE